MAAKLRVLQGTLRRQHGGSAGAEVKVRGDRFVIGSGMDCQLRCPSSLISSHHCAIEALPEPGQFMIRDLASEAGTFVNGERLGEPRPLRDGDVLRIGRLEFEVVVEASIALPPPPPPRVDPVGDRISEMLVDADREARTRRLEDPSSRRFSIAEKASSPAASDPADAGGKKPKLRPKKTAPGKLPVARGVVADTTEKAAEEVLKKFFERPRK